MLVVADDAAFSRSLEILLEEEGGCSVSSLRSAGAALACLDGPAPPRLVIGDLDIGRGEAEGLVREMRRAHPEIAVLILTAHHPALVTAGEDPESAPRVIATPLDPGMLLDLVGLLVRG